MITGEFLLPEIFCAIDMKSYYASVEAVSRNLDPLTVKLLVADPTRSDQTICLAVSPALKAIGVPSRPRLFEAKKAIQDYERRTGKKVDYITAPPRMALYEQVSAQIYSILLRYAAAEDNMFIQWTRVSSSAPLICIFINRKPPVKASILLTSW